MKINNKYIFLRHGQTNHQADPKKRILNYPKNQKKIFLSPLGRRQINLAAKILGKEKIDKIYCSPMPRTRQTCDIILKTVKAPVIFNKRLVDINMGIFHERSQLETRKYFTPEIQRFKKRSPQGESWNDVIKRVGNFLKDIEKKNNSKIVLVISHADPIWFLAGTVAGCKTENDFLKVKGKFFPETGQIIRPIIN
jgi:broad specificity phosphatase PhoE